MGVGESGERGRHRRRMRWSAGCLAILVVLSYGLVDEIRTQVRLHHVQTDLVLARGVLETTSRHLVGTEQALGVTNATKAANQANLNQLAGRLALAQQHLAQAKKGLELQNFDITTLNTCVSGVQQAIRDLQGGDAQAAIKTIGGVASPCESLQGNTLGGPAYPFDFPDPDVVDVSGTYFAYGTNSAGGNIQIIESNDLAHWKTVGDALPKPPAWTSTGYIWAPAVLRRRRRFLLYYATVSGSGPGAKQCISVATARHPGGPFVDSSRAPLVCQATLGGSIDPAPYTDGSGKPYLAWKSNGAGGQPATIWAEALSPSAHDHGAAQLADTSAPAQPTLGGVSGGGPLHVVVERLLLPLLLGQQLEQRVVCHRCCGVPRPPRPLCQTAGRPLLRVDRRAWRAQVARRCSETPEETRGSPSMRGCPARSVTRTPVSSSSGLWLRWAACPPGDLPVNGEPGRPTSYRSRVDPGLQRRAWSAGWRTSGSLPVPDGTFPPEPPHRGAGHFNCGRCRPGRIEDYGTAPTNTAATA